MPNTAYNNNLPRMKYHLEYWKEGDSAHQIQNSEFHSAYIDGFLSRFSGHGKYTVIFLKCLSNGRVLIDRRKTWTDKSLRSLIEDLKTVDQ
jgi:hypothetical protein